jgi:hypothetical protein
MFVGKSSKIAHLGDAGSINDATTVTAIYGTQNKGLRSGPSQNDGGRQTLRTIENPRVRTSILSLDIIQFRKPTRWLIKRAGCCRFLDCRCGKHVTEISKHDRFATACFPLRSLPDRQLTPKTKVKKELLPEAPAYL